MGPCKWNSGTGFQFHCTQSYGHKDPLPIASRGVVIMVSYGISIPKIYVYVKFGKDPG